LPENVQRCGGGRCNDRTDDNRICRRHSFARESEGPWRSYQPRAQYKVGSILPLTWELVRQFGHCNDLRLPDCTAPAHALWSAIGAQLSIDGALGADIETFFNIAVQATCRFDLCQCAESQCERLCGPELAEFELLLGDGVFGSCTLRTVSVGQHAP
jgi:hypothetical protein